MNAIIQLHSEFSKEHAALRLAFPANQTLCVTCIKAELHALIHLHFARLRESVRAFLGAYHFAEVLVAPCVTFSVEKVKLKKV